MMSANNKHIYIVIPAKAGIQQRVCASYKSCDGRTAFWMPEQVRHDKGHEE